MEKTTIFFLYYDEKAVTCTVYLRRKYPFLSKKWQKVITIYFVIPSMLPRFTSGIRAINAWYYNTTVCFHVAIYFSTFFAPNPLMVTVICKTTYFAKQHSGASLKCDNVSQPTHSVMSCLVCFVNFWICAFPTVTRCFARPMRVK